MLTQGSRHAYDLCQRPCRRILTFAASEGSTRWPIRRPLPRKSGDSGTGTEHLPPKPDSEVFVLLEITFFQQIEEDFLPRFRRRQLAGVDA